ncbi:MAG: hypothetical protein KDI39_00075 [Pseudomonadales bacterium]|nr:hypothetical protein [Pseudomonadales bacterium]
MAIIVYITKECQQEIQHYSLQEALDRLKTQLETDQDTRRLEKFPSPYWMKKKFGRRQGRLVIQEVSITHQDQIHQVFVFLLLIQRGDNFYDELSYNIVKHGQAYSHERLKNVNLQEYVAERLDRAEIIEKPKPNVQESAYLYAIHHQAEQQPEQMIYESHEWFNVVQQTEVKQIATRIFDTLTQVEDSQAVGGTWLSIARSDGYAMLVRSFPVANSWFLAGIAKEDNQQAKQHLQQLYHAVLNAQDDKNTTTGLILQYSRKAYPALLSAEENLWKSLEFDAVGNLALSPEESEVLASAKDINNPFPLFINGRAGSGKSTVLQYLFADYLYYYLKNQQAAKPVYFSCSPELIKRANEVVSNLLLCGGKYWHDDNRQKLVTQQKTLISDVFKAFREFLYGHIQERHKEAFAKRNYVDYARFRQSWEKQFKHDPIAKQKYSADVSWHVIRSYIKGTSSEFFLEPTDYQDVEQKQQTVSDETFKLVFEKVWEWYKEWCSQHQLWDDQDLARLVLTENLVQPQFAAIFCDESQDFTRLELEVILRLSLFSSKRIESHEIRRIPFAFAGDQFQTLNPTGFRWEATKAQFVEKFIFALETHNPDQNSVEMNYKELSYNFRSAPPIVRFSNVVQVLRALLFKLNSLRPQIAWGQSLVQDSPVMRFSIYDSEVWQTIKRFKDIVFIVPCAENEETDYIQQHEFLKTYIQVNEDGSTSLPVLSASRAKGLEFNRVVVLDFARHIPRPLKSILESYKTQDLNMESDLALQYFLNRLYVAVTRAKRQLIILDTEESLHDFWHYFTDPATQLPLHYLRHTQESWQNNLGVIADMPISSIAADGNNDDNALENAREFARNGREQKDAYLLRQAGSLFRQVDETMESLLCFAKASELEKQFIAAAKFYTQAHSYSDAFLCCWRGLKTHWGELINVAHKQKTLEARLEFRFVTLYRNNKTPEADIIKVFDVLSKNTNQVILNEDEDIQAWSYVCEQLLNRVVKSKVPQEWSALSQSLAVICQEHSLKEIILLRHRAEIAFLAHDYLKARELWEASKDSKPNNYYIAVAESDPFPNNMGALFKLKRWSTLLEQFNGYAHKDQFTTPQWSMVAETLLKEQNYADLLTILPQLRQNMVLVKDIRRAAEKAKQFNLVTRCRAAEIVDWVQTEQWGDLLKYWDDKKSTKQRQLIVAVIVRSLARSDAYGKLGDQDAKYRDGLQDIVRQQYFGTKEDKTPLHRMPETLLFEVGAALERTRRFVDVLNYYEAMIERFPKHQEELAKRWIVCKERQVKYHENLAKRSDDPKEREKNKAIAEDNNNRANKARHKINLSVTDHLPELPILTSLHDLAIEFLGHAEQLIFEYAGIVVEDKPSKEPKPAPHQPLSDSVEADEPSNQHIDEPTDTLLDEPTPHTTPVEAITEPLLSQATLCKPPVDYKVIDNISLLLGDYTVRIIRKSVRINITHNTTGDTFLIKLGGKELSGDWNTRRINGCVVLENTPLWLHINDQQPHMINVGHGELNVVLAIDISMPE